MKSFTVEWIFLFYNEFKIEDTSEAKTCPMCRCRFKLSKKDYAFAQKTGRLNERIVTCPVCGFKGRMTIMKD